MRWTCLPGVAAVLAAALSACGGQDSRGGRDRAERARLRANEKVEREARYHIPYFCRAERRSEALGTVALERQLTPKGAPGSIHAQWDLTITYAAAGRSDTIQLTGVWNSVERHPAEQGPGHFFLHWNLYPPAAGRHPRIGFRTMAGETVPLLSSSPLENDTPRDAHAMLAWADIKRAEAKGRGLYAVIEGGAPRDRRIFPLPEHMLADVETAVRALADQTAVDARDYRARCRAVEQVPIVD